MIEWGEPQRVLLSSCSSMWSSSQGRIGRSGSTTCGERIEAGSQRVSGANGAGQRYREQLRTFVQEEDRKDTDSYHLIYEWENVMFTKPVDFGAIPKFVERRPSVGESIAAVPMDVALLVLLNVILFMVVYASFIRADVR